MVQLQSGLVPRRHSIDNPQTPSLAVEAPVSIVEGVQLDSSIFSPAFLDVRHSDIFVEIRRQLLADEPDWRCISEARRSTLGRYVEYQQQYTMQMPSRWIFARTSTWTVRDGLCNAAPWLRCRRGCTRTSARLTSSRHEQGAAVPQGRGVPDARAP
jgi:hypothetical protein